MSDHILSLTTTIEPAKTFEVDGEAFQLLGFEHLSPEEEARATAAFTRFAQLDTRLSNAKSDAEAQQFATQLRKRRIQLITMLTTLPTEIAEKLPISAQTELFKAVQAENAAVDGDGFIAGSIGADEEEIGAGGDDV